MRTHSPNWQWLAVLATCALAGKALALGSAARFQQIEEPRWLRLQISDVELGTAMEVNHSETSFSGSSQNVTYDRFFVGPELTLSMDGTIYHSNFIRFNFSGGGAYGWTQQKVQSSAGATTSQEMEFLGNFHSSAIIFGNKPLNDTIFADYSHSYREYDFFTRSTVETLSYGTRLSYSNPSLALGAGYVHYDEQARESAAPTLATQDTVTFDARNTRPTGSTVVGYSYNQTDRGSSVTSETVNHNISLADTEQFGSNINFNVSTSLGRHESSEGEAEDQLLSYATLGVEHSRKLRSNYSVSYSQFQTAGFNSQNYAGHVDLQHQLYGSLTSTLLADASLSESRANLNSGYTRQFGGGVSESYIKRLGTKHRFHMDASFYVNALELQSTGRVLNERHTFPKQPALESFFLNLLDVDETTIVVTDSGQTQTFSPRTDYQVVHNGSQTAIERRPFGSSILEGSEVLVSYQARPAGVGTYETASENFGVRLDLFKNLWGVYARLSHIENNAPATLHVPTMTTYTVGTSLRWQRWNATAEYLVSDSTESKYSALRFSQSGSWNLDPSSSLNAGLGESFTDYSSSGRTEENYRITTTYRRSLGASLYGDAQAGVAYRNTTDTEQLLAIFRPTLNYHFGQTNIQLVYDFSYDMYGGGQERNQHILTVHVRRRF